jgi:hypothetical protein
MVVARLFFDHHSHFLVSCTPNAPYRDLNVLSDPSNFSGYIGSKPQQKSFYGRTYKDPYDLALIEFDEKGDFGSRATWLRLQADRETLPARAAEPQSCVRRNGPGFRKYSPERNI